MKLVCDISMKGFFDRLFIDFRSTFTLRSLCNFFLLDTRIYYKWKTSIVNVVVVFFWND